MAYESPPPPPSGPAAHDAHVTRNSKLGLILFLIYFALYLGFMGIAAFKYELFGRIAFGGLNVAIVYGMGLIIAALVLALIYIWLCKPERG